MRAFASSFAFALIVLASLLALALSAGSLWIGS